MQPSFLAYVVKNHSLAFEDAATDLLAFLLDNCPEAKTGLRDFVNKTQPHILPDFAVKCRARTKHNGVPDIVLSDSYGAVRMFIESKFRAALTPNQPEGYLMELHEEDQPRRPAMLMFIVPKSRVDHYFELVLKRCNALSPAVSCHLKSSHILESAEICALVATWDEILPALKPVKDTEFKPFLIDLERMCKVAEPDEFQELNESDLAELQAPNNRLASRARNFMSLASEISSQTLVGTLKKGEYDDEWGEMWCGRYGRLGDLKVWIGFATITWSKHGKSPIWIEIEEPTGFHTVRARLSSLKDGEDYFQRSDGKTIDLPIPLGVGSRDRVLERCVEHVLRIKKLLNPLRDILMSTSS